MTQANRTSAGGGAIAAAGVVLAIAAAPPAQAQDSPIFIDRERLDVTAPPAPQAPVLRDEREPPPRIDAAPDRVISSLQIIGEADTAALRTLEIAAAPLRGAPITAENLQRLIALLRAGYESEGLALVRVFAPPQAFESGRVQIVILKGYVADVAVEGVEGRDAQFIRDRAAPLVSKRPLLTADLQRALMTLGAAPGFTLGARFEPGGADPSAVRLKITARKKRYELGAAINNQGQALLGRTQFEVTAAVNGALVAGDRMQVYHGFPADFDRYRFGALVYRAPIGVRGMEAQVMGSTLHTAPNGLGVEGDARTASAQLSYPLIPTQRRSLIVSASFDALSSDSAFLGQIFSQERTRVLRQSATYVSAGAKSSMSVTATVSVGVDGLGARVPAVYGGARFTKANLRASTDWALADRLTFSLRGAAQFGDERLPPSERLQFGGAVTGRGFDAGYASSSQGATASAELVRRIGLGVSDQVASGEVFSFVDGGRLARDDLFATPSRSLASAGLGIGMTLGRRFTARLQGAQPISGGPRTGDEKVQFVLRAAL